ncbi:MAG: ATP-binding protein [Planctomycetaceae bacterium]|nr:ATP-binding protein [Planctomycetaceae bacterium]
MSSRCTDLPILRRDLPAGTQAEWSQVDPRILQTMREAVRQQSWPLVIWGNVGSGKTSTAALLYASWSRDDVKWFSAAEFVRVVQTARRDGQVLLPGSVNTVGEESIWRVRVDQSSLVILDDLGTRMPTDSQYEILFELIDRRAGKPLVVSTNHSPDGLANIFDERITSRLLAGTVIEFALPDRRRQQGRRFRVTERLKIANTETA